MFEYNKGGFLIPRYTSLHNQDILKVPSPLIQGKNRIISFSVMITII